MRNKKLVFFILFGLVSANILAWFVIYDINNSQPLEVVFFDIGQGDSIFIETPQKQQILIDGGPSSAILEKLAAEMPFYDRTIDLIILTHPEHDHYFGLFEVLKRYEVKNILWTGIVRQNSEWKEWDKLIKEEEAVIKIAQSGQKVVLQKDPLIFMEILHPSENLEGQQTKNTNNTSIVAHLFFKDVSFLFTGDIGKKVERELIEKNVNLESDVLKVCHHGSKTSSSLRFLEKVLPKVAVISAGKDNNYGHPHDTTLANLEKFAIQVLRTDENGNIKIFSDGENLDILSKR